MCAMKTMLIWTHNAWRDGRMTYDVRADTEFYNLLFLLIFYVYLILA